MPLAFAKLNNCENPKHTSFAIACAAGLGADRRKENGLIGCPENRIYLIRTVPPGTEGELERPGSVGFLQLDGDSRLAGHHPIL